MKWFGFKIGFIDAACCDAQPQDAMIVEINTVYVIVVYAAFGIGRGFKYKMLFCLRQMVRTNILLQ